jgi:hypothetical protein
MDVPYQKFGVEHPPVFQIFVLSTYLDTDTDYSSVLLYNTEILSSSVFDGIQTVIAAGGTRRIFYTSLS